MMNEKSAGAVIYNIKNKKFLLLFRKAQDKYRELWDFPRGIVEEDEISTVKREIKEETGINKIEFIPKFREVISFFYKRDDELIKKEIVYYLVKTEQEKIKLSYEHDDYKWADFKEAIKLLTHKNSREILRKANKFLRESLKQKTLEEYRRAK